MPVVKIDTAQAVVPSFYAGGDAPPDRKCIYSGHRVQRAKSAQTRHNYT